MRFIFAPDSFKGTFSSTEIIQYLQKGAEKFFPDIKTIGIPMADGGEGTVDTLITALGGKFIYANVMGPLGNKVNAKMGIINDVAIIEMAQASGITLISNEERNPLNTTTYGTGEMILEALNMGVEKIIIGIGGSATNDGGIGMAQALGVKFYNNKGKEIGLGGKYLLEIQNISIDNIDQRIKETEIQVICDVTNPLTGPTGATYVYGPQKGATDEMLKLLEEGMINYNNVVKREFGLDLNSIPSTGAAGGLGAGLIAFANAKLRPGIETILDLIKFDELIKKGDIIVTGEGKIDGQSIYGKVPVGIAKRCKTKNIPVIVITGCESDDANLVYNYGIDVIISTVNRPMELDEAINNSQLLLESAIDRMYKLIKIGNTI